LQCDTATNGKIALNKLKSIRSLPDIIFLDLSLPIMNGFDFLIHIKKENGLNKIPTTSFSAFAQLGSPSVRRIPVDLLLLDLLHRLQTHLDFGVVCHLIQSVKPHIQFLFVRTGLCSLPSLVAS